MTILYVCYNIKCRPQRGRGHVLYAAPHPHPWLVCALVPGHLPVSRELSQIVLPRLLFSSCLTSSHTPETSLSSFPKSSEVLRHAFAPSRAFSAFSEQISGSAYFPALPMVHVASMDVPRVPRHSARPRVTFLWVILVSFP